MTAFRLDPSAVAEARSRAEARAAAGQGPGLAERVRSGDRLPHGDLATLLLSPDVDTEELLALAERSRPGRPHIETFSPLYITNECDAECAMCGMRRLNQTLVRETADDLTVEAQLDLLHRRGLRAVALLTGEFRHGARRDEMISRATRALGSALDLGFEHVLINIGALERKEYEKLLATVPRNAAGRIKPHLTMCTFQETYDPSSYGRFMGANPENPRADFVRRLENFDRAADAGMNSVNPGILLGLNRDLGYELIALLAHVQHLVALGLNVYVSLPRLRKASGTEHRGGISDEMLYRIVAVLSFGAPDAKVVISTREPSAVQRRLLPVIGVLTPGSPGVAPYTETGARFELDASQFEVLDKRPIEAILGEFLATGATIDGYVPRASA